MKSTPTRELLFAWIASCLIWLVIEQIFSYIFDMEKKSGLDLFFYVFWMGTMWTLIFNWKLVKSVFKKKTNGPRQSY